ncbi:hypothetical protein Vadar_016826 [Vaccinium darrowii]|uniref:Uncharacterized protein n=1 Tax=Vaccinium darrowii TaxID=229202 RepID=A0ACB7YWD8_9ERIC|nr:hypothetical protein Vadar_016826 [Vaccinium darrowii]
MPSLGLQKSLRNSISPDMFSMLFPASLYVLCSNRIDEGDLNLDSESIIVPDVPHRIEFKKTQLPKFLRRNPQKLKEILDPIKDGISSARGILVNSFEEMELKYVEEYKKVAERTWCIGPVSLSNKEVSEKFDRGNKAAIDEHYCLKWLDSKSLNSVIYACFGSLGADKSAEVENWLEADRFEDRNIEKGLVIKGWAPQVMILSHPAVGGFLTHCGWNSTLEGVCAGVPMITWPMFAEQFYNENLITEVLRIGVRIGVEVGMQWGNEDEVGVFVRREKVKKAIEEVMRDGEEGGETRRRARELAEMAKKAIEEGGSSYLNMTLLIDDVIQNANQSNGLKASN